MRVLVLNAGSATLKATVLDPPDRGTLVETTVEWDIADPGAPERSVRGVLDGIAGRGVAPRSIDVVGYRVVHGGDIFTAPVVIDDAVVAAIESLVDLAPLHDPIAAATIRAGRAALPDAPHVACFDTAFHASLPEAAIRYPVPDAWTDAGIRRYGFHGLSVTWSVRRAAELLERPADRLRLVVAHLGGGCSVTAVDGGRSVSTSMGMTPLEGLMMGTRSGSIDPAIVLRRWRGGDDVESVSAALEHRSGLLAVGGTADMRALLAAEAAGDARAGLAIEMFVRRAAAGIGAAATALPAVDAIVFTGGIGQHSTAIRARIAAGLAVLRVPRLDRPDIPGQAAEATQAAQAAQAATTDDEDVILATVAGGPAVLRIAAREDLVIADAARALLG
jgi:acetate kinase